MKKTKEETMEKTEEILADDAAIIRIYEKVLNGELKSFPKYTWELPNSLYYAKVLIRYLFEGKLNWSLEEVKKNLDNELIKKYRLKGMKEFLFSSLYEMVDNAYPNEIKQWELRQVPNGFWYSDENKRAAFRWMFEGKLRWDIEDIKKKLSSNTFDENGLGAMFNKYFKGSSYKVVEFVYPGKIKPWQLRTTSMNYWQDEKNVRYALKWFFEEKLNGDIEEIKQNVSQNLFIEHDLGGLLHICFNGSPYLAIEYIYPNKVKPWELNVASRSYWKSDENIRKALKWLFDEKLKWSLSDIKSNLSAQIFVENDLSGLLAHFKGSPYKVMKFYLPHEEFKLLKDRSKTLN